jgi:hypothetical protein
MFVCDGLSPSYAAESPSTFGDEDAEDDEDLSPND